MLDKIKNIYLENREVVFKIYGVEYVIKDDANKVLIYQINNDQRQKSYNSIDTLLDNYTIYGETIRDNEKHIEI